MEMPSPLRNDRISGFEDRGDGNDVDAGGVNGKDRDDGGEGGDEIGGDGISSFIFFMDFSLFFRRDSK